MKDFRRSLVVAVLAVAAIGCERSKKPVPVDSGAATPANAADSSVVARARTWNSDIGPVLLIAGDSADKAVVLFPGDSSTRANTARIPRPASVTLLGRSGTVQTGEVPTISDSGSCTVATVGGAPPPHAWNVGFIGGVVAPIPVDSTEAFTHADSVTAVTWMNRLASPLPNDPAGRFAGLPFVVRGLWRFKLAGGTEVVAANLARQINQEATPLQEHTFLIAEHPANDTTLATAYFERSYGDEETIETHDVLAAVTLGASRQPALIVARDFGDENAFRIIERVGSGRWRAGWSSPRRHC
ncbi:MAG TPA: hypothetical protein VH277_16790 [Gemmatimonadaceae bacterium]|jgi:hypothetical protein|nr:hypothetical protein [Gemmatimonadaceae bacterium]